ncbi:MAG TPA: ATP-binding protein [bacterium]|nr:ATP-binding protein [bacterium]
MTSPLNGDRQLAPDALRLSCDAASLGFATTAELQSDGGPRLVGQPRAVRALDFGLRVNQPGYNVFISGPPGTGRMTYARSAVDEIARGGRVPPDWCYVRNFTSPSQPIAILLPSGIGRKFQRDVRELLVEIREGLRQAFMSEAYERRRAEVVKGYEQRVGQIWEGLDAAARSKGLLLQRTPTGIATVPVDLQGKPIAEEVFNTLPEADRTKLQQRTTELGDAVTEALRQVRALEREGREALRDLERQTAQYMIDAPVARLREQYADHPRVIAFFDAAKQDMLDHLSEITQTGDEEGGARGVEMPGMPRRDPFARYQVNLLVDHAETKGAPVIIETNPTYYNLVGRAELRVEFGALVTDLSMIKPGALHLANGGFLLLHVRDVLTSPFAYEGLKRALRSGEIRIEPLGEAVGALPTATLRPDPIPLDLKILLVGTSYLYHLLYALDEDFEQLFKIRADFDVAVERTPETMREYARAIAAIARRCGVCEFDAGAVAEVIDHGARVAGEQDKLSTRFNEVTEIVFEAAAWAKQGGRDVATREDVRRAVEEKALRSNLIEEKIREAIASGQILVDTDGTVAGQINGLAVLQLGDYTFGQPSRITARVYVGSRGVVNIERETQMSGRIHSKGVFVLSSFFASRFAQEAPLSLSASLTFEQLYSDVDGDSASSTELYALLSELSRLPIDQGIATTGSVNQRGEIQPIGGVNEKIEGFYLTCKARGLTGRQGVIIPHQNVRNLMLRGEVVDAVRDHRFHVWAVRTIDEGIEILTGVAAGTPDAGGNYPEDSVNGKVKARLADLAQRLRQAGDRRDGGPQTIIVQGPVLPPIPGPPPGPPEPPPPGPPPGSPRPGLRPNGDGGEPDSGV